jgi:MarR family transcriptional regulator for hemolysin
MMLARNPDHHFLFALADLQRAVRAYADQRAARYGITRSQWAVLVKLHREEGLQQAKLAKLLDIQPITLTRLVDRLCANGLVERRADPNDRRAKQLYLTAAARPLIDRIADRIEELSETVLDGIAPAEVDLILSKLGLARESLKAAIERNTAPQRPPAQERVKRYG